MAVIDIIREKVRNRQYEFTFPHFFEEMANDNLTFRDIEMALTRVRVSDHRERQDRCIVNAKIGAS